MVMGLGLLGMLGLVAWWGSHLGLSLSSLQQGWHDLEGFLKMNPWCLFLALVMLPGLPIPTSALMFLAGVVWREHPVQACLICILAMALNMSWTYALAAGPGRRWAERLLRWRSIPIPELSLENRLKWVWIMRLTPGIPLFLQNYLLGFLKIPFGWYLLISVPCNGFVASGVVLSGAGIADGSWSSLVAGVCVLSVGVIGVKWMRKRMKAS